MRIEKDETTFGYGCPECGIGTVQPTKVQNFKTKIKGNPFTVDEALIGVCDHCDAHHFSSVETKRWRRMYEDRIRKLGSFLPPEEISILREKLGLSRDELARLIGCTRQSIRTWEDHERENLPSRMADLLMKLVDESYKETAVDVISFLLRQASAISEPIQVRRPLSHVDSDLILPWLSENLQSLHSRELELRTKSVLELNSDKELKEHLAVVYEGLNLIYVLTKTYRTVDDDELTLQYLGCRLFNSAVTALNSMLSGYYQSAFVAVRDILETGFLLDFFRTSPEKVAEWRNASPEHRMKEFSAVKIRISLDDRDGFKARKRERIYKALCEYAAHPSYPGFKLLAPNGLVEIGPFFSERYLRKSLEELAMRLPVFASVYFIALDQPSEARSIADSFYSKFEPWVKEHQHAM